MKKIRTPRMPRAPKIITHLPKLERFVDYSPRPLKSGGNQRTKSSKPGSFDKVR